jgi:hypothetical protein
MCWIEDIKPFVIGTDNYLIINDTEEPHLFKLQSVLFNMGGEWTFGGKKIFVPTDHRKFDYLHVDTTKTIRFVTTDSEHQIDDIENVIKIEASEILKWL